MERVTALYLWLRHTIFSCHKRGLNHTLCGVDLIVLGVSAFYHDSAAALVADGEIVAAAQEERFTRVKGDASFPSNAIRYCLEAAGISLVDVDYVGYYDKPILTFDRLIETYLTFVPRGFSSFRRSTPIWLKEKLQLRSLMLKGLDDLDLGTVVAKQPLFGFHHHSHAASAYYPSPFDTAAVLVLDGVGEWATTSLGRAAENKIDLISEIRFPHSLGLLYSAFAYYLGFKVNDEEYKMMGLAPYGRPVYVDRIYNNLIDVKDDGSYRLDMRYFNYCTKLAMTSRRFHELFDGPPRNARDPIEQRHMDLAASVQFVTEEVILRLCRTLVRQTGERNLCLAGGVALNCVANGRIVRERLFENVWIQPAAGDAGGALGVALAIAHENGVVRPPLGDRLDRMAGAYLGPSFDTARIHGDLDAYGAVYRDLDDNALFECVAAALDSGNVVGWFQGRMEFGPRALGNRSILADARSPRMQRELNLRIKYREGFRPFAPAVLREDVADYFDLNCDSPYMLLVANVSEQHRRTLTAAEEASQGLARLGISRSNIPAVTHVDGSSRVQTVHRETNPRFYRLLSAFRARTGCGVVVNTSFNIRDEPIVCTPAEAYRCFMGSEIEMLVLENTVLWKEEQ